MCVSVCITDSVQGQVYVNAHMPDKHCITIQGVPHACWHRLMQHGVCERPQEDSPPLFSAVRSFTPAGSDETIREKTELNCLVATQERSSEARWHGGEAGLFRNGGGKQEVARKGWQDVPVCTNNIVWLKENSQVLWIKPSKWDRIAIDFAFTFFRESHLLNESNGSYRASVIILATTVLFCFISKWQNVVYI